MLRVKEKEEPIKMRMSPPSLFGNSATILSFNPLKRDYLPLKFLKAFSVFDNEGL